MKISRQEQDAITKAIELGKSFGFGNIIAHLQTAWARSLMEKYGMEEQGARHVTGGSGYPFKMQDDLIEHGFWDESGKSYEPGVGMNKGQPIDPRLHGKRER